MKIVDDALLKRFSGFGQCERCRRAAKLDPHHVFLKRGMGGANRLDVPENLIGLCRRCHDLAEAEPIVNAACGEIVALRLFPIGCGLRVQANEIRDWLNAVAWTPKGQPMPQPAWVTDPERFRRDLHPMQASDREADRADATAAERGSESGPDAAGGRATSVRLDAPRGGEVLRGPHELRGPADDS